MPLTIKMNTNTTDYTTVDIDSIRKTAVSRRGGVRVRGGRLPPIRIRDVTTASHKKVIEPKIPQRRLKIKQSLDYIESIPSFEKIEIKDSRSSFNRRRGNSRVYLQTEGSFLEQGPALAIKKESVESHFGRIPRTSSRRIKAEPEVKYEAAKITELLESYDEKEGFTDNENDLKPVRMPPLKVESKLEIKDHILDNDKNKLIIKKEPVDEDDDANKWTCSDDKVLKHIKKEDESKAEINDHFQDKKLPIAEDAFLLFQLPSRFPFEKSLDDLNESIKKENCSTKFNEKDRNSQDEIISSSFKDVPEGHIGKLQIMKSGRMKFVFGSIDIAIEKGISESFAEVASIPIKNNFEGDLIFLGKICEKMVLKPIFNHLKEEKEIKKEFL